MSWSSRLSFFRGTVPIVIAVFWFACASPAPGIIKDLTPATDMVPEVLDVIHDSESVDAEDEMDVYDTAAEVASDIQPDLCAPDCADKACGPDGCGGICGQCTGPDSCKAGQCTCVPACTEQCGPDGCGSTCPCDPGQSCQNGICTGCPEVLDFPDAALQGLVAATIDSDSISLDDVAELHTLEGIDQGIMSLAGLECLTALKTVNLSGNNIQDITPLEGLLYLDYLALTDNKIEDTSALNQLPLLTTVVISANTISTLTPLSSAWHLETLKASQNSITDLSPLANLTTLRTLNISGNSITDLSPLSNIPTLEILEAHSNTITTIPQLPPSTTKLILHHNAITDLSPLLTDPAITPNDTLDIRSNPIDCALQATVIEQLVSMGVDVVHDCGE